MNTITTKPLRKLPHVWKRFYQLDCGDGFYCGENVFHKSSFVTASSARLGASGRFFFPWTRVRTLRLVRKSVPAPGSNSYDWSQHPSGEVNAQSGRFVSKLITSSDNKGLIPSPDDVLGIAMSDADKTPK